MVVHIYCRGKLRVLSVLLRHAEHLQSPQGTGLVSVADLTQKKVVLCIRGRAAGAGRAGLGSGGQWLGLATRLGSAPLWNVASSVLVRSPQSCIVRSQTLARAPARGIYSYGSACVLAACQRPLREPRCEVCDWQAESFQGGAGRRGPLNAPAPPQSVPVQA